MKLLFTLYLFLFSTLVWAQTDELLIQSVSNVQIWQTGRNQEVKIEILLPQGFHAYTDQFKISQISPADFAVGSLRVTPEIEFYDKFSKKTRQGIFEKGTLNLVIEAPNNRGVSAETIQFDLRYQICSETVCYLPQTKIIQVKTIEQLTSTGEAITAPIQKSFSLLEAFDRWLQSNLFLAFVSVFIAGILTSFTPCIFPMLPITISVLGYHANQNSRMQNLSRALAYVFGIAITYASLGVVAALTGSLFGSMLTNKYVLSGLVFLFFAMALSMWGAYELQSPAFIRNRLGAGKSKGLSGAFLMGLAAGIVASPCVGPVLISILTYVSTTKNAVLGFSLLFTFALGLGLLFIVIGLFSSALKMLPKSGRWMDAIKFILGAGMWGAALYYLQFLVSNRWWIVFVAISFVALSIWKGAFEFKNKKYISRSFLLSLFIFSSAVSIVGIFKPEYLALRAGFNQDFSNTTQQARLNWQIYSDEGLLQAQQQQKPVMIDFFAEWCAACHELEEKTFSTDEFKVLTSDFVLMKFDATEDSPSVQEVLKKYQIKGLPTVMFVDRKGNIMNSLTFTQFLTMEELRPKLLEAAK